MGWFVVTVEEASAVFIAKILAVVVMVVVAWWVYEDNR